MDALMARRYPDVSAMPVQGKRGPGAPGMTKYSCSLCKIDYQMRDGAKPFCPLCDAKEQMESLRREISTMAQEANMLKGDLEREEARSSLVGALREAVTLADLEDKAMIKAIAYRWRVDPEAMDVRAVRLSGRTPGRKRLVLEIHPQGGEVEYFSPTSVGGVVFVETYEELVKAQGVRRAMEQYAQAIASQLAS